MKGHFIVIEGLDGTGKTTQTAKLAERLRADGEEVFITAEPTALPTGKLLRRMLSGEVKSTPWASAALFLSDRILHNTDSEDGIIKHLENNETVLCDRYYYSTFAYQGTDADLDWAMDMHYGCKEIMKPELVIFLTMSPEKCIERITRNRPGQKLEIYENTESLSRISKRFDDVFSMLKDKENIVYIDASDTIDAVNDRMYSAVKKLSGGKND